MGTVLSVVSVSLIHDPVVRTSSLVPCTGAEEWTIVASGPPAHIFHTAGGSLDTGKWSTCISAQRSPQRTSEMERTALLVRYRKDRRDEERQAKCYRDSEWCRVHPCKECLTAGEYQLVTNARLLSLCVVDYSESGEMTGTPL